MIINGANNVSAFGFSPNGRFFVLITLSAANQVSLDLYSVQQGRLVSTGSPLVTNPLSWGFSPDDDNRFFLVASSNSLPTHVDLDIFRTGTGTKVMDTPSSVIPRSEHLIGPLSRMLTAMTTTMTRTTMRTK